MPIRYWFCEVIGSIHYWYAKWYTDMYPLVSMKNGKKKKKMNTTSTKVYALLPVSNWTGKYWGGT